MKEVLKKKSEEVSVPAFFNKVSPLKGVQILLSLFHSFFFFFSAINF